MKLKAGNAIFALLSLNLEMAAKQRVFQNVLLKSLCETDEKYAELLVQINEQAKKELELVRASIFHFSEVDIDNLLNGDFEV